MSVDVSAVARVLGITTTFKDLRAGGVLFLPQRIAVFAQGNAAATYGTTKRRVFSAAEVGLVEGWGSPAHLIMRELFPENGDGVGTIPVTLFPLAAGGGAVAAAGTITPSGTVTKQAAYRVRVGGILSEAFVVPVGATVAARVALMVTAINAVLSMPVIAADGTTVLNLTAKWEGLSGNDLVVEVIGDTTAGNVWGIVQPSGGLVNPSLAGALAQIGNVWESMALSALNYDDETALDAVQTFGEGRWGTLVKKPMLCFWGSRDDLATTTALTDSRPTDRVNSVLPNPGSPNLPFVNAAAQLVRIAKLANNNPPHDYGSQRCQTLIPGLDSEQWDYIQRDAAVKAGCSTIEVKDGVVNISDVVTMWRPTGEVPPAYRHVVNVVKLQQIIFNLDLIFASAEWDGAPMVPDDDVITNPTAKKPKMAKAAANQMLESLGMNAIISAVKLAKSRTTCVIDAQNPMRWNLGVTVQLSGNSNVKDINLMFGFYFGTPTPVG